MDLTLIFAGSGLLIVGVAMFWGCSHSKRRFHVYALDLIAVQVCNTLVHNNSVITS
jgi:hypothetical protein